MGRLFGTDGVRGLANAELTAELALDLSVAAAHVLTEHLAATARPVAVVGHDPRASGEFLEAAVVAGLASAGMDVARLHVVPTPAVAYLTTALGADMGVMISASHNPMPDNGIKFFDSVGAKLPDVVEDEIEARLGEGWTRPVGADVGRVGDASDALERYLSHLAESTPARLDGLRVVVDCAHGAACVASPRALAAAGAEVLPLNCQPDGYNINDGVGSTHPEQLARAVVASGADAGIAHDGDADRCLAVDHRGEVVDGDAILAICALAAKERGQLRGEAVATTVMTNLGFHQAMARAGIGVVETPVGDRYVLEGMRQHGLAIGGEQSGHLLFLDHATTGDGILTALQLLGHLAASGSSLAELASVMTRLPQVLLNVTVADRDAALAAAPVREEIDLVAAELGGTGRVLVRPSGTEPVIRVMVEAPDARLASRLAERIAAAVRGTAPPHSR
ncbi:MAG: phosphoglucosamine mutase [Mycobacteriales bacterium]